MRDSSGSYRTVVAMEPNPAPTHITSCSSTTVVLVILKCEVGRGICNLNGIKKLSSCMCLVEDGQ